MSFRFLRLFFVGCLLAILQTISVADVLVQLNVNRPLNDVNEKFVNFAIKPEELYRALDGDNRRVITRMAALLGESYVKFTNDYEFAMHSEMKLRNPTKIIWKGFSRWARAVNWTMVIPLPYDPETWDPMETLRILNSSYLAGINECVWQLGTDFGASHADDYVAELGTLNTMVESFRPYVDDWRIMGADISAGSSADETRRYIEMSKDLNAAFGWTQPSQPSNPLATLSNDNEPALRVLLRERVPVWLTLPQKAKLKATQTIGNVIASDEATEGLNWAKTLGEAASTGYDAVFKRITATDLERPTFSYYVSALFKKVMGSRVFPARPLNVFTKSNKLFTHCANTVSGGIAFMIVNMNDQPLQVQVHSLSKMTASEVWQYTLTMKKGATLLNNEKLLYNSTLRPKKTQKQAARSIQLSTPGRSVSFWILPNVNLDHCQYTEVIEDELNGDSGEQHIVKRYSSADKLLRKLIQESSVASNPLVRAMNRNRRYATNSGRFRRFVLKDKGSKPQGWAPLLRPFANLRNDEAALEPKLSALTKREHVAKPEPPLNPFSWFTTLMENTMTADLPLLKRAARSVDDDYFGPLFATKDGKTTTAFTKRITEIKRPEQNIKPLFDMDEFDEEEFFKKLENYREPVYPRLPDGDVLLQLITNPDGEELDELAEERPKQNKQRSAEQSQEVISEMKPLRLLPTELYESFPLRPIKNVPKSFPGTIGSALNTLLFPEPFTKKPSKSKKVLTPEKDLKPTAAKAVEGPTSQLTRDFIRTQKELIRTFGEEYTKSSENDNKKDEEEEEEKSERTTMTPTTESPALKSGSSEIENVKASKTIEDFHFHDYFPDHVENFFGNQDHEPQEMDLNYKTDSDVSGKHKFDELPWWDLDLLKQKRKRRALYFPLPEEDIQSNLISKDEELVPLGVQVSPGQLVVNEKYILDNSNKKQQVDQEVPAPEKKPTELKLVATFKEKVSNLVDIVARQFSDWYDTFTKHIDGAVGSAKKVDNSTATTGNNNVNEVK